MDNKNIAIIYTGSSNNPPDRQELVALLQKNRANVFIFGIFKDYLNDYYKRENVKFVGIKANRKQIGVLNDIKTILSVRKEIKKNRIDIAIIYGIRNHPSMAIGAKLGGAKVMCVVNGKGNLFSGDSLKINILKTISLPLLYITYHISNSVCFQNPDDKDLFIKKWLVSNNKVFVTDGSGVNLDKFDYSPLTLENHFVFLARITESKGIKEYIKACEILKRKYVGIRCSVYGNFDRLTEATIKMIEKADASEVIEYHGRTNDVLKAISEGRFFVFPSYYPEGIPRSILQALAIGRPIITTDMPGCKETVIDGYNGYTVRPKDVNDLVEKMEWMIKHQEEVDRMALNSRKIAEKRFDVDIINKQIISNLYDYETHEK